MRRLAPAVLCLMVCLVQFSYAQCGGSERWAVKDGTDSQASQVDLSHIQNTTIQHLINDIDEPQLPHNNTTRVIPDEAKVVRFTAHLVKWKHELDDDDYHLVLTDDSLRFTPHNGNPTGTSLIGEIPDPNCLPGKYGNFGHSSPFLTVAGSTTPMGIRIARKELEDEFPDADISGKFNDAGGVLVDVVGVIFFDPAHGQVGRSPHNLEIHPILSIRM